MFMCNTSAIKDWSYFLSQILPLMNRTAGLVKEAETAGTGGGMVAALQPDVNATEPPLNPGRGSGMEDVLRYSESDLLHTDNRTSERDPTPLPKAVLYLVMAALVVVAVAYAIVGHLVKDVVNDFVGGRSVVADGDGGQAGEPGWALDTRRVSSRNKMEIKCISNTMNDVSHTYCLSSGRTEETVVNVDPAQLHPPPATHDGT